MQSRLRKAARIILVGAPGVGKGTQTERMLKQYPQLSAISSGDLLRENVRRRTPLGIQAEHLMTTGALVPDSMILRLIRNALTTRGWLVPREGLQPLTVHSVAADFIPPPTTHQDDFINVPSPPPDHEFDYSDSPDASFILDGFPRTAGQATQLATLLPMNLVVHIHTPPEIIMDRICNRWIHAPSGRVYNTTFNAPKVDGRDDVTGEPLTQRDDDKPEVWEKRLKSFEQNSMSLLEHYDRKGVLWKVQGNSSDEITPKLLAEFQRRFGA
ncbi:adenylate kinase [Teratosphaeria destructans]|uniref:GTP:AMP phosphotransferase, mitochondrial n=1 Tax=Teratosphaeria destructans TaxID=418781 RepID=A0A9W7SYE6_9PEZI|nr:adenylate kinase [Teratosphaeria destructans]